MFCFFDLIGILLTKQHFVRLRFLHRFLQRKVVIYQVLPKLNCQSHEFTAGFQLHHLHPLQSLNHHHPIQHLGSYLTEIIQLLISVSNQQTKYSSQVHRCQRDCQIPEILRLCCQNKVLVKADQIHGQPFHQQKHHIYRIRTSQNSS